MFIFLLNFFELFLEKDFFFGRQNIIIIFQFIDITGKFDVDVDDALGHFFDDFILIFDVITKHNFIIIKVADFVVEIYFLVFRVYLFFPKLNSGVILNGCRVNFFV